MAIFKINGQEYGSISIATDPATNKNWLTISIDAGKGSGGTWEAPRWNPQSLAIGNVQLVSPNLIITGLNTYDKLTGTLNTTGGKLHILGKPNAGDNLTDSPNDPNNDDWSAGGQP
jgi:hypothetical protein